jgi:hypothetical protein
MGYRHYGPRGFFFFPPFGFLLGMFMLFMLFKTGLWIPLMIVGLIFWAMRHYHFEGNCGGHWEKRKHGYAWHDADDDYPQKPKRDEYI